MFKKLSHPFALGLLSGILSFIGICYLNCWAGCICYVPLFIAIHGKPMKMVYKTATIFALSFSVPAFGWMIPAAERFTGNNTIYGIAAFLFSSLAYSIFCILFLSALAWIIHRFSRPADIFLNGLLAASLFCLAEALLNLVTSGLPWFNFHSGNALLRGVNAVQPTALFGVHVLTFLVVFVNYSLAMLIQQKAWVKMWVPAAVLGIYIFTGTVMLRQFNNSLPGTPPIKVAIISENIAADTKWDEASGNMLVKRLLDLNTQALLHKPDVMLWSESAIPWTYSENDELIKAVLQITDPAGVTHILGMNSSAGENEVYNSVYSLLPGGGVAGRYDKQWLLSFIEKPVGGVEIPFISTAGFMARTGAQYQSPLITPKGKAGILICNEATLPVAAAAQVKNGAEFLMNLSNDGWFNKSYIMEAHFYYARLRAVETRKDIAINSNNGFSGMVKASGVIQEKLSSPDPFVKLALLQSNSIVTTAVKLPFLFLYGCLVFLAGFILLYFYKKKSLNQ